MGKKNRYIEEEIPEEAAEHQIETIEESAPQAESVDGNDSLLTQKPLVAEPVADFEWDCGDTRYNIGDKVFRTGARLTGIPIDEDGSPADAALKKAYELNYLKKKE